MQRPSSCFLRHNRADSQVPYKEQAGVRGIDCRHQAFLRALSLQRSPENSGVKERAMSRSRRVACLWAVWPISPINAAALLTGSAKGFRSGKYLPRQTGFEPVHDRLTAEIKMGLFRVLLAPHQSLRC